LDLFAANAAVGAGRFAADTSANVAKA
jgi:hypothetical protein